VDLADATAQAEAQVRAYCGWHIAPEVADTLTLDGPGTGTLVLPSLHVVAIDAITEDGTVLDPTVYQWSQAGIVRRGAPGNGAWCWTVSNQYRWTGNLQGLTVELDHGYEEWPLDVQSVIDRVAARAAEGASVLTQVGAVAYATDSDGMPAGGSLSSSDRAVLSRYKIPYRP